MFASYGGFLKWWYPTTQQPWFFLLKIRGVLGGYQHFRKHPYGNKHKKKVFEKCLTWLLNTLLILVNFFGCAWSTNLQLFKVTGDLGACDSCCVTWPCALSNHFISMVDCHTSQRVSYPYHVIDHIYIHYSYHVILHSLIPLPIVIMHWTSKNHPQHCLRISFKITY